MIVGGRLLYRELGAEYGGLTLQTFDEGGPGVQVCALAPGSNIPKTAEFGARGNLWPISFWGVTELGIFGQIFENCPFPVFQVMAGIWTKELGILRNSTRIFRKT